MKNWVCRLIGWPTLLSVFLWMMELGIRSLSEYTILFYGSTSEVVKWEKTVQGKYIVTSILEFLLIANQTTAIIASDKLHSTMDTHFQIFGDSEREQSMKLIFEDPAQLLLKKLTVLFEQS